MAFDKKTAEGTLVEVRPAPRNYGMGFRLLDDELIVTASHCLRRERRRVVLPNPDMLGDDLTSVQVRAFGARAGVPLLVRAAEPCSDIAILSSRTAGGTDLPSDLYEKADALFSALEPAFPALDTLGEAKVFLYTHERRWISGVARGSFVWLSRGEVVRGGTSGAPVFTEEGRVLGLVSFANIGGPQMRMCLLADYLPGWVLRMAHAATSSQRESRSALSRPNRSLAHYRHHFPASTQEK